MIKLRVLGWGDCPGLSRWVLNAITRFLTRGKQKGISYRQKRKGGVKMEPRKGKNGFSTRVSRRNTAYHTMISAQ